MPKHILHFSAGTLLFILLCVGLLGGCLVTGAVLIASSHRETLVISPDELPTGELGPIGRSILETKMSASQMEATWGPVNKEKLTETKQGWLADRLRARRAQRSRCSIRQAPSRYTVVRTYPVVNPLPSPMPSNPMVPVTPVDVNPFSPKTPTPDIQAKLPEWVVPSVKSDYCETGTCNLR